MLLSLSSLLYGSFGADVTAVSTSPITTTKNKAKEGNIRTEQNNCRTDHNTLDIEIYNNITEGNEKYP
jgi:hypothetical protein